MTVWMIWTLVVSSILAAGAVMAERVAASFGAARRFVWVAAVVITTVLPAIAIRPIDAQRGNPKKLGTQIAETLGTAGAATAAREAVWQRVSHFAVVAAKADGWLLRGWLVASGAMFILIGGGTWRMRRRARGWITADTGFGRIFVSNEDGPAVVGAVRPAVVIPRWALTLAPAERDLMLRHEREHVLAHDSRVLLAAAFVLTLVPWNAALWWIFRRLRLAIEIDCDARVIRAIGEMRAYGAMLLSVGDRYATRPSLAASMAEAGAHLEARITAMMTPPVKKPLRTALPFAVCALGLLVVATWLPAPAPAQVVRPSAGATTSAEPKPLRGNPSPRYPDDLRDSGVEGTVLLTFSTDAQGIPDTSTINVLESSHKSFEAAVRSTLPRWRYDSQGHVRFVVRFMGLDTERREATGAAQPPSFVVEGAFVAPVVVVALIDRPARRSP